MQNEDPAQELRSQTVDFKSQQNCLLLHLKQIFICPTLIAAEAS